MAAIITVDPGGNGLREHAESKRPEADPPAETAACAETAGREPQAL